MSATLTSLSLGTNEDARFLITVDSNETWFNAGTDQPQGDTTVAGSLSIVEISRDDTLGDPGQDFLAITFSGNVNSYFVANSASKSLYMYVEQNEVGHFTQLPLTDGSILGTPTMVYYRADSRRGLFRLIESVMPGDRLLVVIADDNSINSFTLSPESDPPHTDVQRVRLKIRDPLTSISRVYQANGTERIQLNHDAISYLRVFKNVDGAWAEQDYALNGNVVVFASAQSGEFLMNYLSSAFTDDDLSYFLEVGGSVAGAQVEAVEALLFDAVKRNQWSAGDNSVDDTSAQKTLLMMYDVFRKQLENDVISGGGIVSWGMRQGRDYR